jgi:hypothetical protein
MGATDGFRLDVDEVAGLAAGTDDLAARVRVASDQVRAIHVPSYGEVGATFAEAALAAATSAGQAVADAIEAADQAADALRAGLADYLSTERAATTAFDGLGR